MDPARSGARQPHNAQPLQRLESLRQSGQRLCGLLLSAILAIGLLGAPAHVLAALPPGNAVTDPAAILRDALPIEQNDLQEMQHRLESTSDDLRAKRWSALTGSVRRSQTLLSTRRAAILASLSSDGQSQAEGLLDQLEQQLQTLSASAESSNRDAFLADRRAALSTVGELEALLVGAFPFEIPAEFAALPRLLGRATVAIETTKGPLTAVVDGYNAPLTAGAFVDLVQKGFYDGLPLHPRRRLLRAANRRPQGARERLHRPEDQDRTQGAAGDPRAGRDVSLLQPDLRGPGPVQGDAGAAVRHPGHPGLGPLR
jgi:peptidylprolyl isomerase